MMDDLETAIAYDRLSKNQADEQEYDSGESEEDLLSLLDLLDGGTVEPGEFPATAERGWDELTNEEQSTFLDEVDRL